MLGRVPHVIALIVTQTLAMRVWGIDVPPRDALVIVSVFVIAAAIPISPSGLGTAQAVSVFLFAEYAPGVTHDERAASVLAFSIVHFAYMMMASIVVGALCLPYARRIGGIPRAEAPT
jgi:uncharacterized membrane protein YbhN (UPF0104 family)